MEECKFTDEEIIKALELCIQNAFCENCEYREKTDKSDICPIRTDALNLINKQKTDLDLLKSTITYKEEEAYNKGYEDGKADMQGEVEKLQNELVIWKQNRFNIFQNLEFYERARQKVASEIFAEIEMIMLDGKIGGKYAAKVINPDKYAELKKKYTED